MSKTVSVSYKNYKSITPRRENKFDITNYRCVVPRVRRNKDSKEAYIIGRKYKYLVFSSLAASHIGVNSGDLVEILQDTGTKNFAIKKGKKGYGYSVTNYCLSGNHFRTNTGSLNFNTSIDSIKKVHLLNDGVVVCEVESVSDDDSSEV